MNFSELTKKGLSEACSALLPASAPTGSGSATRSGQLSIAAVIGFAGQYSRGTLGVTVCEKGLRAIAAHHDWENTDDVLGELANLLLGHVKRTFCQHGVEIELATPVMLRGLNIEVCGAKDNGWTEASRDIDSGRTTVWLDAHADEELTITAEPSVDSCVGGGDTILF